MLPTQISARHGISNGTWAELLISSFTSFCNFQLLFQSENMESHLTKLHSNHFKHVHGGEKKWVLHLEVEKSHTTEAQHLKSIEMFHMFENCQSFTTEILGVFAKDSTSFHLGIKTKSLRFQDQNFKPKTETFHHLSFPKVFNLLKLRTESADQVYLSLLLRGAGHHDRKFLL